MEIYKIKREDFNSLMELYKQLVDFGSDRKSEENTFEKMLSDDRYLILAARDGDNIIGSAMGIICESIAICGRPFLVIEDVIVAENYRRKGIARAIFEKLDEFARERNCVYSILVSTASRTAAHSFYEKMGFKDEVKGFRKIYF